MRLFLALTLDPIARRRCDEAIQPLRLARPSVHWVAPHGFHLTLKFLGEQPESLVAPLADAIDTVAAQTRPIDLCIGAVGAFPALRRPRTIYLTVTPEPKLELLHHDIEVTCATLGLPLAGRPFRPHVTIGREPEPPDLDARRALRAAARLVLLRVTAPIPGIDLVESEQTESGTRYRLAHHAPFRDG